MGYNLPTRILYLIPLASIYAIYKYCEAMERLTNKERSLLVGLLLALLVNQYVLIIYAQSHYNKMALPSQQTTPSATGPAPYQR